MSDPIGFDSPYPVGSDQTDRAQPVSENIEQSPVSFAPPPMTMPEGVVPAEEEPPPPPTLGSVSKSHLLAGNPQSWSWEQLRDYVVEKIVERNGNFPRNVLKESGIFKGFLKRHGDRAGEIAIYAMDGCNGWWKNSPIGIERFAKGSDPWFALEIIQIIDNQSIESLTDRRETA